MIKLTEIIKNVLHFLSSSIRKDKSASTTARKRSFSKDAFNRSGFVLMAMKLDKRMNYFINLPVSFNYEEHIINFPPEQYGFVDSRNEGFLSMKMLFVIWQIEESALNNERAWKETGFIAVSGVTFQKRVQNYKQYLQYLINTNVIECDNHYIPEVIPLGYRFSESYRNEPFRRIDLTHGTTEESFDDNVNKFNYLTYWYKQGKLTIDSVAARNEAFRLYSLKKDNQEFWSRGRYGKLKPPYPQYMAAIHSISKIELDTYNLKISPKVHRLYSNITAIPSKYRKYLKYDNQNLGCIDVKNCQSYIACLILNPDFWKRDSTLPLNLYSLPQNVIDLFDSNLINMIGEKFSGLESLEVFNEYIGLVSRGRIYEDMIAWALQEREKVVTRKRVKDIVFSTIFSPVNSRKTWLHDYYTQKFGHLIDIFNIIKSDRSLDLSDDNNDVVSELEGIELDELEANKPHARLSILFQAIESEIILHKCCKRIFEESNHTIPLFTVHDCIITTQSNLNYLESIMIEEFTRAIGYHPPLDIERW